jgi:hypothetical protein
MIEADLDILCGAYPKKSLDYIKLKNNIAASNSLNELISMSSNYAINFKKTETGTVIINNNLAEIDDASTGFLLIKREVLQTLKDSNVTNSYINDITAYGYGKQFHDFFPCGVFDNRYLSEDFGFCRLCQKVGYKIFCDISVRLNHIGQFSYNGNLFNQLQNNRIYFKEQNE